MSPKFKTPTNALWLSAIIALILSLSAKFESILTSFAVVGIYLSFQLVVFAAMAARLKGFKPTGVFNLRGWFWPVSLIGFVYGVSMMVYMARPGNNASVPWYINYEIILATSAIIVLGIVAYVIHRASESKGA